MPSSDPRRGTSATRRRRRASEASPGPRGSEPISPISPTSSSSRGVVPSSVTDMQRARMLAAAADVVGELGYEGMSVARVTTRARVSRRTFYELFEDREDCFLAVYEHALARVTVRTAEAYAAPGRWRERIRSGLGALLGFLDEEPDLARLCVVEALGAGQRVLERRQRVLEALRDVVDEGRTEVKSGRQLPPLTAEGTVGAVSSLIHARLLAGDRRPLSELLNPLMGTIVLPYLGAAAAARELAHPSQPVPGVRRRPAKDPLEGLEMRLTYRTLCVLTAIGAHQGASNRQVAAAAEVQDQGQISKLLARLEHLGLVVNTSQGHAKGEPNAWQLTPRGRDVEHTINAQTATAEG
jgi:AcrR family transcriptional regulator